MLQQTLRLRARVRKPKRSPARNGRGSSHPPVIEEEEEEEVIIVSIDNPHDAHAGDPKVEADSNYTAEGGVAL